MGSIFTGISAICPGKECAKYVCNSMQVHSQCSDCCDVDIETTETGTEHNEEEIKCEGCCYLKKKT